MKPSEHIGVVNMKRGENRRLASMGAGAQEIFWLYRTLRRLNCDLRAAERQLPPQFADLRAALLPCQQALDRLEERVAQDFEVLASIFGKPPMTDPLPGSLSALKRCLVEVTRHLRSVANDLTPELAAKLADNNDPMADYDIDAHLYFLLRKDDPEYCDGAQVMTTKSVDLKYLLMHDLCVWDDSTASASLENSVVEQDCSLFHDLHTTCCGRDSPRLPLSMCPRVGKVDVDVQVCRQYVFSMPKEDLL